MRVSRNCGWFACSPGLLIYPGYGIFAKLHEQSAGQLRKATGERVWGCERAQTREGRESVGSERAEGVEMEGRRVRKGRERSGYT